MRGCRRVRCSYRFDEDEPGFHAVGGSGIDGILDGCVVTAAVLGYDSVKETCFGLRALHCGECQSGACEGVAAAVGDGSSGNGERIVGVVVKTVVVVDDALAAEGRSDGLAVESGVAGAGQDFSLKVRMIEPVAEAPSAPSAGMVLTSTGGTSSLALSRSARM